jgi:hypothetical protein
MFTLVHAQSLRTFVYAHLPTLVLAFAIAEVFYKFHSFALECVAFIGTWYLLDGIRHVIFARRRPREINTRPVLNKYLHPHQCRAVSGPLDNNGSRRALC